MKVNHWPSRGVNPVTIIVGRSKVPSSQRSVAMPIQPSGSKNVGDAEAIPVRDTSSRATVPSLICQAPPHRNRIGRGGARLIEEVLLLRVGEAAEAAQRETRADRRRHVPGRLQRGCRAVAPERRDRADRGPVRGGLHLFLVLPGSLRLLFRYRRRALLHDMREFVREQVELDDESYVKVDAPSTRTNVPGVFAAGDLVDHT
jgi:hypothetical protein